MKSVSSIIVIILLLMIVVAITGLAYVFFSGILSQTTQAGTATINTATTNLLAQMKIESMSINSVYIRNIGQSDLTNFSVYVNDVPANFNVTPSVIKAEQSGTINIYDFIKSGDNIRITTMQGAMATTIAPDPCSQAVACYKFDEGSGTIAYDSSPYGNDGTITNTTNGNITYTSGIFGSALNFTTIGLINGPYVSLPLNSYLNVSQPVTITAWIYPTNSTDYIMARTNDCGTTMIAVKSNQFQVYWGNYSDPGYVRLTGGTINLNTWYFVAFTYDSNGNASAYVNGVKVASILKNETNYCNNTNNPLSQNWKIGYFWPGAQSFNGTIDEVRIYNKAIY